jgi:hypothetical protein
VKIAIMSPLDAVGEGTDPPVASIDLTVDGETAVIDHVVGDPIDLDRVTLHTDGDTIDLGSGTLTPGESLRVDVGETEYVDLVYEFPTGRSTLRVDAHSE